ncbi:MAG: SCP2 sterol-binding domain-containing protein [Saprospiraceae bacterium]
MKTAAEFIQELPSKINPAAVEGLETCFHFDIAGEDGGEFTLNLANNELTVSPGFIGEPKCTVKASSENLMKVIKGETNPLMAIMMGKLKISNQGEMLKYAKIFGLM